MCSCSWLVRLLSIADITDPTMIVLIICMVKDDTTRENSGSPGAPGRSPTSNEIEAQGENTSVESGSSSSSPLECNTQIGKLKHLKAAAFPGRYYRYTSVNKHLAK